MAPAAAQTRQAKAYKIPRTADGHPDLQGMYDLATITPVDRPAGAPATYTKEQARKIEAAAAAQQAQGDKAIEGNRTAPPKGGDGSVGAAGNVGGYNTGWLDPGSVLTVVDGQTRSSIIIDPPDGRAPPMTPMSRQRAIASALLSARPTSDTQGESNDPGLEKAPGAYDDPERRPLGERCLLGFGSTSGPPALPDYFYNNLHQIVQTPNTVMILDGNGARCPHSSVAERTAPAEEHPPRWVTPSAILGVATRWLSIPPLSQQHGASCGPLKTCTSSSASLCVDDRTPFHRFTIEDPDTIGVDRGPAQYWLAVDRRERLRIRALMKGIMRSPIY